MTGLASFDASALGDDFNKQFDKAMTALARLDGQRDIMKPPQMSVEDGNGFFTDTIRELLKTAALISSLVNDSEVSKNAAAYVSYIRATEFSGQERALAAAGIAHGRFPYAVYMRYLRVIGDEETFLKLFDDIASPAARA